MIYIMGAIFLLGLLSIMVKGSSTPGAGIDQETLILRVNEVQQYGQELERAVAYVLRNGHSEVDIRFAHPDASSSYGDITDTPTRQVFAREGGAAAYREPPDDIQTIITQWNFSGRNTIKEIGTTCAADSCSDLTALLMNVSKDFCLLMNEKNNIENVSNNPPQDISNLNYATIFTGSYQHANWLEDTAGDLSGHLEGCFEGGTDPPAGTYHYYRVLLVR